jgi:hypothetical protein
LLAVAQFYHFAFLVVSLALLGFGASGSILSIFPGISGSTEASGEPATRAKKNSGPLLRASGVGFAVSTALAYGIVNLLPFDSYSIAWERRQVFYFVIYYLALGLPFLFSGLGIGGALMAPGGRSHLIYAANLLGSGVGALIAPLALWQAGVPGAVLLSALLGLVAVLGGNIARRGPWWWSVAGALLIGILGYSWLTGINLGNNSPVGMTISPYKGLANALRYPGSTRIFGRWNAISRVDLVADAGTRQLPGLSYAYPGSPPPQHGLSIDADSLQPVTLIAPSTFEAADYLPEALAFDLRKNAPVLVLKPGGGLGVLQALAGGASEVTAVINNPLTRVAIAETSGHSDIYAHEQVVTVHETERVFLRRTGDTYEVIFLPLTDPYRPVTSGAYSLTESYDLTVEAFEDMLARLEPGGLLVVSRWLQTPPSESLRLIATIVEALERGGVSEPDEAFVAYRGIQTMTVMAAPRGWAPSELAEVRDFTQDKKFDLVWMPDIRPEETNRYNRLLEPAYYLAVRDLLASENRQSFYQSYPFSIAPPHDNQPFFFHFFRWGQTPELLATLGRTWQPFGGSGYFVLLALLALVITLSTGLIITPLFFLKRGSSSGSTGSKTKWRVLAYFTFLGLAFLFVEIPLIQRWILLLGHPTYAFTVVVLAVLALSSLGSALARSAWLPRRIAFAGLVLLALLTPWLAARLPGTILGWPFFARAILATLSLAPLAVLMGMPFPLGLGWLERNAPDLVPWAWAVNGCASVVAAVLAAILALSYGFTAVLLLGAAAYAGAFGVLGSRLVSPSAG